MSHEDLRSCIGIGRPMYFQESNWLWLRQECRLRLKQSQSRSISHEAPKDVLTPLTKSVDAGLITSLCKSQCLQSLDGSRLKWLVWYPSNHGLQSLAWKWLIVPLAETYNERAGWVCSPKWVYILTAGLLAALVCKDHVHDSCAFDLLHKSYACVHMWVTKIQACRISLYNGGWRWEITLGCSSGLLAEELPFHATYLWI